MPDRLSLAFEQRSGTSCPAKLLEPHERAVLALWSDWAFYGRQGPALAGSVAAQPAWVTGALAVLTDEQQAIVEAQLERRRKLEGMKS